MSSWLWTETLLVAEDYMNFCVGIQRMPPSEPAKAMRCLAKKMESQQQPKLHSLVQSFLVNHRPDPSAGLKKVMAELMGERLNWGRVVSLFAFTGVLASELCSRGDSPNSCRRLAETMADYLCGENHEWLLQHEGWGGFSKFFNTAKAENQELAMKTALFAVAGLGIAGITFLLVC